VACIHVRFFALASRRATVAAVIRTPFDRLGKQMVRDAVDDRCSVESDAEVPANTRRIDLWVTPLEARASAVDHLGLLGRVTTSGSVTLEFFHNTPSGEELHICLIKHGEFRHFLSRRKTLPPLPIQWVISSGRPDAGIDGLGFRPMNGGIRGIYESPPLHCTRLVVVSELPVTRDTILMRLLGAGSVLKLAIAELQTLPAEAPERRLALPVLVRLRLTVPADPAQQTSDDQEFLMDTQDIVETWRREAIQEGVERERKQLLRLLGRHDQEFLMDTQDIVETWRREAIQEGVKQGLEQGERKLLLRQLRRRFGAEIDGEVERRVAEAPAPEIEVWAERVLSAATLAELLAD
jgi:hypothetical protein